MNTSRFIFTSALGGAVIYGMMLWVGVNPGDSVHYSPPSFSSKIHTEDTHKNTLHLNHALFTATANHVPNTAITPQQPSSEHTQPAAQTQPLPSSDNTHINNLRSHFFTEKKKGIGRDDKGNYRVSITNNNAEQISIESASPIYYPSESDLNYGVKGCVLGGYYIELNQRIALITQQTSQQSRHEYRCDYNATNNAYILTNL